MHWNPYRCLGRPPQRQTSRRLRLAHIHRCRPLLQYPRRISRRRAPARIASMETALHTGHKDNARMVRTKTTRYAHDRRRLSFLHLLLLWFHDCDLTLGKQQNLKFGAWPMALGGEGCRILGSTSSLSRAAQSCFELRPSLSLSLSLLAACSVGVRLLGRGSVTVSFDRSDATDAN